MRHLNLKKEKGGEERGVSKFFVLVSWKFLNVRRCKYEV